MNEVKRGRGKPKHPKNAEIVAIAVLGTHPAKIAELLSIQHQTVTAILYGARKRGIEIPRQKRGPKGPWAWKHRVAAQASSIKSS